MVDFVYFTFYWHWLVSNFIRYSGRSLAKTATRMGIDERSNYWGSSHSFTEWWLLVVAVLRVTVNLAEKGLVLRTLVEQAFVLLLADLEPLEGAIASPLTFPDALSSRGQVVQHPAVEIYPTIPAQFPLL